MGIVVAIYLYTPVTEMNYKACLFKALQYYSKGDETLEMKTLCNIFMQNLSGSDTPFEQRTRYSGTSPKSAANLLKLKRGIDRFIRGVNSKRYLHFVGFYFRSTTLQIRSSKASTEHR